VYFLRLITANKIARKVAKHYYGDRYYYRFRKTKVPCSCTICGHRRKWLGITRQEKKQLLRLKDYEDNL